MHLSLLVDCDWIPLEKVNPDVLVLFFIFTNSMYTARKVQKDTKYFKLSISQVLIKNGLAEASDFLATYRLNSKT